MTSQDQSSFMEDENDYMRSGNYDSLIVRRLHFFRPCIFDFLVQPLL